MEALAAELARLMCADPIDPFAPERIVVPHPTIGRWLSLELARGLGVAANLGFEQPAEFAWSIMRGVVPQLSLEQPYEPASLRWRIHDLLPGPYEGLREGGESAARGGPEGTPPGTSRGGLEDRPEGGPSGASAPGDAARGWEGAVRGYLRDGDPRKRLDLADRLARVYDQCLLYRPDWIREWEQGAAPHWQARLWQRLVEMDGPEGARHWVSALDEFRATSRAEYDARLAEDVAGARLSQPPPHGQSSGASPHPRSPASFGAEYGAPLADNVTDARSSQPPPHGRSSAPFPHPHLHPASPPAGGDPRPPYRPRRACFFAVPALSPSYLELLREAAREIEIHLFLLDPCREYWGDIHSRREIDYRAGGADPDAHYLTEGNELLAAWGRAGRDMIDALVETASAEWDDHFVPPAGGHRLAAVQRDILDLRLVNEAARDDASLAAGVGGNGPSTETPARPPDETTPEAASPLGIGHETTPPAVGDSLQTTLPAADDSLQIHVCHSPMREAEVLHDRLLALFDTHRDLEPADVLVLTPDLEVYGPAIEAVFAAAGRIPCNVARARAGESRTLRAFLDLLSLPGSRHGAEAVLAPLAAPAVRVRFGIKEADLPVVRGVVREAGIRWGVDEAHRGREDLPETAEHTWRQGLRRLLLGYAMTDAGAPVAGLVPCLPAGEGFGGGEMDGELLGHLVSYCEEVFGLRGRLAGERRPAQWGRVLRDVAGAFLADGSEPASSAGVAGGRTLVRELAAEAGAVRALIRDFERETARAEAPAPFEVVLDVLREHAQETVRERVRLADGVTVASLGPGRIFPAEVVCVAGMNDGVFPRSPATPSFDVIAAGPARRGDRDIRYEDRYAFLEALLAARRGFLVTYAGRGLRDDAPIPPSVLVDELKDYLGCRFPGVAFETRHPLQPFSPRYFAAPAAGVSGATVVVTARDAMNDAAAETRDGAGDGAGAGTTRETAGGVAGAKADGVAGGTAGTTNGAPAGETGAAKDLFSYSRGMCEAAKTMLAGMDGSEFPGRFVGAALPEPDESLRRVDLADLAAFFANPTRFLLRERFGLRLELDDLTLDDDEPFELDGLERYRLRSDIWGQAQDGVEPERAAVLLHGSGRLPQAGLGRLALERARAEVEPLASLLAPYRTAIDALPCAIDFEIEGFRVVGTLPHVARFGPGGEESAAGGPDDAEAGNCGLDRMVWWRIGSLRARDRITIRLRQLAWAAAGHEPLEAVVIRFEKGSWTSSVFPPPDDPREQLGRWLHARWRGLAAPLPFFPESSFEYAKSIARSGGDGDSARAAAREKARDAWFGGPYRRGERLDPYLSLIHEGDDPLADDFENLAAELLVPLAGAQR